MAAVCWGPWPAQGEPTDLTPCGEVVSAGQAVPCCGLGDTCLSDNICSFTHSQSGVSGYYTAGCTDRSFSSPCARRCFDVSRPDITFNTTTTATWDCCGTDSNGAATCGNPTNESFHASSPSLLSTYAIAGITTFLSAVSSTLSTVPSSTPLSTVSSVYSSAAVLSSTSTILAVAPTVTTTVTNTGHPSRLQAGAIVGIVIGAIAAAIFLSSIVYYFWRRKSPQRLPGPDAIVPQQAEYHRQAEMQGSNIWEMQKANDSKQLTAYDSPHELSP